MLTNLKRVFSFAMNDFRRNKGISIAAIFVLAITVLLITGLFLFHGMSNYLISSIENKIDITAYFKATTPEGDILNAKAQILALAPSIKNIQYVSQQEALDNFTQKHSDNPVFANALTQVGDNPFLPSLNITTTGKATEYQQVAAILQRDQFNSLIDSVDYAQKKDTIDKIFDITSGVNRFMLVIAALLMLVAVLVVYNTIKLAIDSSKEEINTMRMVGASAWFIRMPFIIQGATFGVVSFIISFLVSIILVSIVSPPLLILSGLSILNFFIANVWLILLIQLGFGVALGVISSMIVVQKYLRV